jgi:hypothetical protein
MQARSQQGGKVVTGERSGLSPPAQTTTPSAQAVGVRMLETPCGSWGNDERNKHDPFARDRSFFFLRCPLHWRACPPCEEAGIRSKHWILKEAMGTRQNTFTVGLAFHVDRSCGCRPGVCAFAVVLWCFRDTTGEPAGFFRIPAGLPNAVATQAKRTEPCAR